MKVGQSENRQVCRKTAVQMRLLCELRAHRVDLAIGLRVTEVKLGIQLADTISVKAHSLTSFGATRTIGPGDMIHELQC